ncbi:hypothetical protein [Pseudomonas aeruginosa]|uniref:hypothetical protein n=1 Tax=Pseudomonas aeruginosa TaxID=287 RepID=UPI001048411F|nr:hypothetical protein [Pseudomonas aeruginosa]
MNKFAAALEEKKNKQQNPVVDINTFIQSAASDGDLSKEEVVVIPEPVVEDLTPLKRALKELSELQSLIKETGKKGKIERMTASMHKEQLLKAEIIRLTMEEEKGVSLSMSQIVAMLIDKRFSEIYK